MKIEEILVSVWHLLRSKSKGTPSLNCRIGLGLLKSNPNCILSRFLLNSALSPRKLYVRLGFTDWGKLFTSSRSSVRFPLTDFDLGWAASPLFILSNKESENDYAEKSFSKELADTAEDSIGKPCGLSNEYCVRV